MRVWMQVEKELLLPVLQEEARPNRRVKRKVAVAVQLLRSAAKKEARHECMVLSYRFIVAFQSHRLQ